MASFVDNGTSAAASPSSAAATTAQATTGAVPSSSPAPAQRKRAPPMRSVKMIDWDIDENVNAIEKLQETQKFLASFEDPDDPDAVRACKEAFAENIVALAKKHARVDALHAERRAAQGGGHRPAPAPAGAAAANGAAAGADGTSAEEQPPANNDGDGGGGSVDAAATRLAGVYL